jgi:hypothetical protein
MALPVNLVVEDELSEFVCRRLLTKFSHETGIVYGKKGFGYIRSKLQAFNHAATKVGVRYLVLTDLDQFKCPAGLWTKWLPGIKRDQNLTFRIAVREVESWLLADFENLHHFLGIETPEVITAKPDAIPDPKLVLLKLACKSPKRPLRESLVFVEKNGKIVQGPDYNGALRTFVEKRWSIEAAANRSDSLARAVHAIQKL